MRIKWTLNNAEEINQEILNITQNKFLAKLLTQRGLNTTKKISDFLAPLKMEISSPFVFLDMEKATHRIESAISTQEVILIWGDFDADGVTSTALMYKTLKHLGANVIYYIPTREYENHGLNTKALIKLIAKHRIKLIITVDCAISDIAEIKFLNGFKIDTIITDHHDNTGETPPAYAIINPKVTNALSENLSIEEIEYLNYLAGVGVAFKLACALLSRADKNDFIDEILPLVAVGTIADVVPLLGENRCLVECGLQLIKKEKNKGLTELLKISGYSSFENITSDNIAFAIAPRINAAGRLDTVESAFNLLISDNPAQIDVCCQELNNFNKIRQELCEDIFAQALEILNTNNPKEPCIVLFSENWHIGIIGIVAAKLVEKFHKPVFLMTKSSDESIIRCSARGVEGLNLYEIIKANSDFLVAFGGHKLAAGLAFNKTTISFEELKKKLNETIQNISEEVNFCPTLNIDAELEAQDIDFKLIETLNILQPFGEANQMPIFSMNNVTLAQTKVIGSNSNHLKLSLSKDNNIFEALYWNKSKMPVETGEKIDIAFTLRTNEFNGKTTIQLEIKDLHYQGQPEYTTPEIKEVFDIKLYDHRKKHNIFTQVADYCQQSKQKILLFAENTEIKKELEKYPTFASKIIDRRNIQEAEQLMFFDYPPNREVLYRLLETTDAKKIHLMKYINKTNILDDLLKKLSGMYKYVYNQKAGILDIEHLSSFLGLSEFFILQATKLFAEAEIIKILSTNNNLYQIEFLMPQELTVFKQNNRYLILEEELTKINDFRNFLKTAEIKEIQTLLDF